MRMNLFIITTIFLISSCSDIDKLVDKSNLLGDDYRLFQETSVWNLAKAVWDEDTFAIRKIVTQEKLDINFQEERFGNTLLMLAVSNNQYNSCKTLLELGADPNKHDKYNGSSAVIDAARINEISDDNTKFLKLLLQFKGNPNDLEVGKRQDGNNSRETPLIASIQVNKVSSSLAKVQFLVEKGADINYKNEYGQTVLSQAVLLDDYEVVLFLLQKGVNYKDFIIDRSKYNSDGKKAYLVDMLREYLPELDSKEHKTKMKIVSFLIQKGIDYNKVPIPEYTLKEIKERYPKTWKEYKEKY